MNFGVKKVYNLRLFSCMYVADNYLFMFLAQK